jgi:hypothetical protein
MTITHKALQSRVGTSPQEPIELKNDDWESDHDNTGFTMGGNLTMNAKDVVLDTTTGTKIGTATAQKLGFWNATPVVQQVFATGASHTVDELITVLQTLGLVKQS